jgi:transposase-like protein
MTAGKRSELESFWRAHLVGWRRSELNQREYCELHGLPLKRFGNWRATLKHEEPASAGKLLYRRGGGLKHMSEHMLKEISSAPSGYIPSARSGGSGRRRNFSGADKKRIVEETCREGASVSGVARKYGIGTRLLFSWKQELAPAAKAETTFLPVTLTDAPDQSTEVPQWQCQAKLA